MPLLPEVRAAILKAVPQILCRYAEGGSPPDGDTVCRCEERPIRLADVLRAMNGKGIGLADNFFVNTRGHFYKENYSGKLIAYAERWPLSTDNLDDCSEETIAFLHSVLC